MSTNDTGTSNSPKGQKKLQSRKVNDDIEKKGATISGGKPNPININPVIEQAEHTAVTNLNMRAQPPHKGHAKIIKAVEDEAKKVGGSAHIVTSHSEGDEKNPIPTAKKVGYLKKMAASGTHVSATSKEAPSVIDTARRLNQHAHHLVVVAGSDRADEYHKLLHKYNGKEGFYNFKSITVKSIGRDPDAEGTAGVSGTKMREHAKNGNIAGFKAGLHPDLHQHAEEMMNDINKASKKKMKESIDELFGETFIDTDDTLKVLEAIDAAHREAVPRKGDRKKMDLVPRSGQDRKTATDFYRQQSIEKQVMDEAKKKPKSGWDRIWDPKTISGRKMIAASDEAKKAADELRAVAKKKVDEASLSDILSANKNITNPNKISVGQKISLPSGGSYIAQKGDSLSKIASNIRSGGNPSSLPSTMSKDPQQTKADNKREIKTTPTPTSSPSADSASMPTIASKPLFGPETRNASLKNMAMNRWVASTKKPGWATSPTHASNFAKNNPGILNKEEVEQVDEVSKELIGQVNKKRTLMNIPSKTRKASDVLQRAVDRARGIKREVQKEETVEEGKRGLWDNIWAKRKRIKAGSGERMRRPGEKGRPTAQDFKDSQK